MINLIETVLDKHPFLKLAYDAEYQIRLKNDRERGKEPLKEHEWWKEYIEEPETINDISIAAKYRIFSTLVIRLFKECVENAPVIKSIFEAVEDSLQDATTDELGEVEVLFLEGITNSLIPYDEQPRSTEQAYKMYCDVMGPKTKELFEENNAFWINLAKAKETETHD